MVVRATEKCKSGKGGRGCQRVENGAEGSVVPPESGEADTNKAEISKLIEIEKYSSMTKDGTTSIEVEYTYVGETETVYDFVIEEYFSISINFENSSLFVSASPLSGGTTFPSSPFLSGIFPVLK